MHFTIGAYPSEGQGKQRTEKKFNGWLKNVIDMKALDGQHEHKAYTNSIDSSTKDF